ncbi:hypothetical protein CR513_48378, partial [Mucuna pruriens]
MNATIQDLKTQIGQLANTVSHLLSVRSSNLRSQTIPNPRGNASAITLRSGKALPQPELQQLPTSTDVDSEPNADSQDVSEVRKVPQGTVCTQRKKMKGSVEVGGIVSALTRNEDFIVGAQQALPKKCRDPKIFSVPCTIGDCAFVDAMLDLGASINVMPISIYKSLNFGDLEPTGMTIQLAN